MKINMKFLLILTFVFYITGCVVYDKKLLAPVSQFPEPAEGRMSVNIDLNARQYFGDTHYEPVEKKYKDICVERFIESGLYSQVSTSSDKADLQVEIELKQEILRNPVLATLGVLSLCITPDYTTLKYKLKAVIRNSRPGMSDTIELEDSALMWLTWFLLPVAPFKPATGAIRKLENRLFDNLALKVFESALFDPLQTETLSKEKAQVSQHDEIESALNNLLEMKQEGLISDEEYQKLKEKTINRY